MHIANGESREIRVLLSNFSFLIVKVETLYEIEQSRFVWRWAIIGKNHEYDN